MSLIDFRNRNHVLVTEMNLLTMLVDIRRNIESELGLAAEK